MRMLAGNTYPQPNGRTTPPPDRFTLVNGQPQVIALKYPTGKQVSSRFTGPQIMYTLIDGRRAYFDSHVAAEIDALRLAPGQEFSICKNGSKWDINYCYRPGSPAAQPPDFVHSQSAAPASRPQSNAYQQPHQHPQPMPAAPRVNGAGEDVAAIMDRCYHSALDIAVNAVENARARGLHIVPTFEDVRCIAATLCINETGGRK